jgi:hypothetical protein
MTRDRARWRAALAQEKRWVDSYVRHLPELQPQELVRGTRYHAVSFHAEDCRLYAGGQCTCRPRVRFFAEPMRQ